MTTHHTDRPEKTKEPVVDTAESIPEQTTKKAVAREAQREQRSQKRQESLKHLAERWE